MAATAYILVNTEPARTQEVVEQLRAIPGAFVREVLGPYDVVVELEADTQEDITAAGNKQRHVIWTDSGGAVTEKAWCSLPRYHGIGSLYDDS